MPSLFRILLVAGTLCGAIVGGLYVLGTHFEPESREIAKPVPGLKIRNE